MVFINPVYKDKVTVIRSSMETGAAFSLFELEVSPGGGNTQHVHSAFEETFTSVKGLLGVAIRDEKILLQPGESITIPKFTPHYFFNNTEEMVTCQIRFTPGHEGFEKGLAILYGLAADGKTNRKGLPRNIGHLALLVDLTDTNPSGITGMLSPIFGWLANKARKDGTEQSLLDKYYYQEQKVF